MYKEITLPMNVLIDILRSRRNRELYLKLLQEHQRQDDEDSNTLFLVIDSYEKDKKKYGYKTKSGLWKALNQLDVNQAIDLTQDGYIYLRGLKLVL